MGATRVMIVDDEPQARRVLKAALCDTRIRKSLSARSGEEALEESSARDSGGDSPRSEDAWDRWPRDVRASLRESSEVPIMIVSARRTEPEKVEATRVWRRRLCHQTTEHR